VRVYAVWCEFREDSDFGMLGLLPWQLNEIKVSAYDIFPFSSAKLLPFALITFVQFPVPCTV